jgi:hypothetical protein
MNYRGTVIVFALTLSACAPGEGPGWIAQSLGEPTGDRPSWAERVCHNETNVARVDPAAYDWPDYVAKPPLLWSDALAQAARAHSQDMHDTPCFQHPSCDGTDTFVRIKMYWTDAASAMGENIMAGVDDPQTAVYNWINEVNAGNTTGHRDNIFSKDFDYHYVGLGYIAGGKQGSFMGYWTQDFAGTMPAPAIPRLTSGAHFPRTTSPGGQINFSTVYYDKDGVAPDRVEVVVDGMATPLPLYRGKPALGAYQAALNLPAGAHRYYFRAVVAGKGSIYPDAGTLGVATTGTAAPPEYTPGGVVADPPPGGGGGHGGSSCAIAPRPSAAPLLLGLFAALTLAARSTSSAPSRRRRRATPPAAGR